MQDGRKPGLACQHRMLHWARTQMDRYTKGVSGEIAVSHYLKGKGFQILERRFRCGPGEVDIIARKGDELIFFEVKTWDALGMESLEHSVDLRKRERIKETASHYLYRHPELGECRIRFDLIFLSGKMEYMEHWEHAF